MNIIKEIRSAFPTARTATRLVWRRKHGRGAWLQKSERPVWTLTPVAAR